MNSYHTTKAVIAFGKAAEDASELNKPIEITKFPGLIVRPQKDLNDREEEPKFEGPSKGTIVLSEFEEKINEILSFTISPVNHNSKSDANDALPKDEETSEDASKSSQSEEEDDMIVKPPNVLIYTDTIDTGKSVKAVLRKVLDPDRYTIYNLTILNLPKNTWVDQVALVVVCGNIMDVIADRFVEYIIHGGKVLSLCSNMLHKMLPFFKTAEVRENELVYFSYGEWKRVRMMHDTFCYQASPKRNGFVENHEDARLPSLNLPESTSVKDKKGNSHLFDVKILGTEETWQNPSILLATLASSGGKVVFSQIHLERDPVEYSRAKKLYETLRENDDARLGIISDLLSTHLEMEINRAPAFKGYSLGYLLSRNEDLKWEMFKNLKGLTEDHTLKLGALTIRFYTSEEIHVTVTDVFLPIVTHYKFCPKNFSPQQYYQYLDTRELGQLVIYADVLTSSMYAMGARMKHGFAIIPRQQTHGRGRGNNVWLSPIGCAMFTLQVFIPRNSILGKQISILQHIVAVAMVSAVRSIPGYQAINLRIKWPNDIYVGKSTKIGGLIVQTLVDESRYICDIGAGINLSNSKPTTCINDVISRYNQKHQTKLEELSYERYLALVFNQLEILLDDIEKGNIQHFYSLYYKYWLHKNASVTVLTLNGEYQEAIVDDIDDFGYLRVNTSIMGVGTKISVHPDRNSFDLLQGLIIPVIEEDI
ncbi:biotin--protein ligase [Lasius niger]|uniref:Biotin--protein ligase n=1 Tax=Lasius niger TaxID=67767 RepID=A0A0J7L1A6_LASNI|nr:biotin--protein ligase [Lasius niger]